MDKREEVVARLQRTYDALDRGDYDSVVEGIHPDIELVTIDGLSTLRGVDEVRAWLEPNAIEPVSREAEEFVVRENAVLVLQRVQGRGVWSGIEIDIRTWAVWTLDEHGLATRIAIYRQEDEAKARRAAGIE